MKQLLARFLRKLGKAMFEQSESGVSPHQRSQVLQLLLAMHYRELVREGRQLPTFDQVGFQVYSESDEDGILLYLFSLIGTTNKRLVDIGAGGLSGSNVANLILNHGWTGVLIDSNESAMDGLRGFYAQARETKNYPPVVVTAKVTPQNVDELLKRHGVEREIDLLCIDIDGIDYWIWRAIGAIRPRVVLVEYQCIWGPEESVTVPEDFDHRTAVYSDQFGIYTGASLGAFVRLGRERGYRLVGCQRYGYNAFFVRNDVGENLLPKVDPAACFRHPFTAWARAEFLPKVRDLPWVRV